MINKNKVRHLANLKMYLKILPRISAQRDKKKQNIKDEYRNMEDIIAQSNISSWILQKNKNRMESIQYLYE